MSWHIENSDSEKRKCLKPGKLEDSSQTPSQGGKSLAGGASTVRNAQTMAMSKQRSTVSLWPYFCPKSSVVVLL